MLAKRGREFSEIETLLDTFYHFLTELNKIKSGKKSSAQSVCEVVGKWTVSKKVESEYYQKFVDKLTSDITDILMAALNSRDSKKVFEIGRAIDFLKNFKPQQDLYRSNILTIKNLPGFPGERWPIRHVAKVIGWPDMTGADGFKTVRRMCAELGYEIPDSRKKANKPKSIS
jgi:hypothetical protein